MLQILMRLFLLLLTITLSSVCTAADKGVTRFAIIGDYGADGPYEEAVATLVKSWKPDFIVTLGDNNYKWGEPHTIDKNIGKYYHMFIHPYRGRYGKGAEKNRFFPILGNHDWRYPGAKAYLDYFQLPGNGRYYDFRWGPVHFFAIDSDEQEPDGIEAHSKQARWLHQRLTASRSPYKLVMMHHPPYSSGKHQSEVKLQWPYKQWGANLVLSGHDHNYERLEVDGLTYVVNGLGGARNRSFQKYPLPETVTRYSLNHGALLVEATSREMHVKFINVEKQLIDHFVIYSKMP